MYIWVLEPEEIINENKGGYYPDVMLVDHMAETPRPGGGNTNNANANANANVSDSDDGPDDPPGRVAQLEPIIIHLDAVCFSLRFILGSADELLILTDKGLMKLKLDPKGSGARVERILNPEEEKVEIFARRAALDDEDGDGDGDDGRVVRRGDFGRGNGIDADEDDDEDEDMDDVDDDGDDDDDDDSDEEL